MLRKTLAHLSQQVITNPSNSDNYLTKNSQDKTPQFRNIVPTFQN